MHLRAPKVDPPRLASSTKLSNFLQISHKPPRASGAWRHPHHVTTFRHLGVLWHLWMARPPRARVTIYIKVCTQLTHVLSRKALSLTKLKGMNRNPLDITLHNVFVWYHVFFIIIISCWQHGYPWPSLATPPYRSSP